MSSSLLPSSPCLVDAPFRPYPLLSSVTFLLKREKKNIAKIPGQQRGSTTTPRCHFSARGSNSRSEYPEGKKEEEKTTYQNARARWNLHAGAEQNSTNFDKFLTDSSRVDDDKNFKLSNIASRWLGISALSLAVAAGTFFLGSGLSSRSRLLNNAAFAAPAPSTSSVNAEVEEASERPDAVTTRLKKPKAKRASGATGDSSSGKKKKSKDGGTGIIASVPSVSKKTKKGKASGSEVVIGLEALGLVAARGKGGFGVLDCLTEPLWLVKATEWLRKNAGEVRSARGEIRAKCQKNRAEIVREVLPLEVDIGVRVFKYERARKKAENAMNKGLPGKDMLQEEADAMNKLIEEKREALKSLKNRMDQLEKEEADKIEVLESKFRSRVREMARLVEETKKAERHGELGIRKVSNRGERAVEKVQAVLGSLGKDASETLKHPEQFGQNLEKILQRGTAGFSGEKAYNVELSEKYGSLGSKEAQELQRTKEEREKAEERLVLGWLKWAEERREEKKRELLADPAAARNYIEERKEALLCARDRVISLSFFNPQKERWELFPSAAQMAISQGLAERAIFRHDKKVLFLTLKAEPTDALVPNLGQNPNRKSPSEPTGQQSSSSSKAEAVRKGKGAPESLQLREYFVDLWEFDGMFKEATGGTDALYVQALANGVPTAVQVMPVELERLEWEGVAMAPFRMTFEAARELLASNPNLQLAWQWYATLARDTSEEIFLRFGMPLIPKPLKQALKLDYAEGAGEGDEEAWKRMEWLIEAERRMSKRYAPDEDGREGWAWWLVLPVKSSVAGYPLYLAFPFAARVFGSIFRPKLTENEEEMREFQRLEREMERKAREVWKEPSELKDQLKEDPIKNAFDRVKRVRSPDIPLSAFPGIESVRDDIAEVVSFLKAPKRFVELGAKPPKGILITGDNGIDKRQLALSLSHEARVPIVEIQSTDLESGYFAGQGATNVRELFRIARQMSPLIIFMEDFEQVGSVRGSSLDTSMQEHESMLNQLLVELDGFESQSGVVLVATTDNIADVDPALRRPGRMDRIIQLSLPNESERENLLRQAAKQSMYEDLVEAVDWKYVALQTAGMNAEDLLEIPERIEITAAQMKESHVENLKPYVLAVQAYKRVIPRFVQRLPFILSAQDALVKHLGLFVSPDDVREIIPRIDFQSKVQTGYEVDVPDTPWDAEFKYPHAVWAAGKGLLAALIPNFDSVENIWLERYNWEGIGFIRFSPFLEPGFSQTEVVTRSQAEKRLVLLYGSYVAVRLMQKERPRWGQSNSLCFSQLEEAKQLACSMVLQYGWTVERDQEFHDLYSGSEVSKEEREGTDVSGKLFSVNTPRVFMDISKGANDQSAASGCLPFGPDEAKRIQDTANLLLDLALTKAESILARNTKSLLAVVDHLCEYDGMDKKILLKILNENDAIFEEDPFELTPYRSPVWGNRKLEQLSSRPEKDPRKLRSLLPSSTPSASS